MLKCCFRWPRILSIGQVICHCWRGQKKKSRSSAHDQHWTYLHPMIPIKMSSLYLSEVHSINLVKWIQRAKDTADRHEAEDRGPDGLADWRGGKIGSSRYRYKREEREGQEFIALSKEGGMRKGRIYLQEWDVMRRDSQRGTRSVKMTGYGFCCHWLSDVKS